MDILERLLQLGPEQPWWVWALAVFIPFCILLTVREFVCWFWKTNALLRRLDKLERRVRALEAEPTPVPPAPAQPEQPQKVGPSVVDEDYSL